MKLSKRISSKIGLFFILLIFFIIPMGENAGQDLNELLGQINSIQKLLEEGKNDSLEFKQKKVASLMSRGVEEEDIIAVGNAFKSELRKLGYSIAYSNHGDINSYRPMGSGEISLSRDLAIVFITDECISVDLSILINGEEVELKHDQKCKNNITVALTSTPGQAGSGEFYASLSTSLWHYGYLIIGRK